MEVAALFNWDTHVGVGNVAMCNAVAVASKIASGDGEHLPTLKRLLSPHLLLPPRICEGVTCAPTPTYQHIEHRRRHSKLASPSQKFKKGKHPGVTSSPNFLHTP